MQRRTVGIKPRSKKRAALMPERNAFTAALIAEHPVCQLASPLCTGAATVADEYIKRSHGGQIVPNEKSEKQGQKWFAACVLCNGYKEDHPQWAREMGLTP